jgi:hypothetical protein
MPTPNIGPNRGFRFADVSRIVWEVAVQTEIPLSALEVAIRVQSEAVQGLPRLVLIGLIING